MHNRSGKSAGSSYILGAYSFYGLHATSKLIPWPNGHVAWKTWCVCGHWNAITKLKTFPYFLHSASPRPSRFALCILRNQLSATKKISFVSRFTNLLKMRSIAGATRPDPSVGGVGPGPDGRPSLALLAKRTWRIAGPFWVPFGTLRGFPVGPVRPLGLGPWLAVLRLGHLGPSASLSEPRRPCVCVWLLVGWPMRCLARVLRVAQASCS